MLTPGGEVAVEALAPGSLLLAVSGSAAPFQTVVAVRRRHHDGAGVRIRAGALADGAPQEDLVLPPGLALLLDGALVDAGALVDGHGIVLEPAGAGLDLVEIVLGGHDAVLAAGAAVETASPHPDAPPCAPRRAPDGTLRALLSWRAEVMGWAPPPGLPDAAPPQVGTRRARLAASPLAPVVPPIPLPGRDPG